MEFNTLKVHLPWREPHGHAGAITREVLSATRTAAAARLLPRKLPQREAPEGTLAFARAWHLRRA